MTSGREVSSRSAKGRVAAVSDRADYSYPGSFTVARGRWWLGARRRVGASGRRVASEVALPQLLDTLAERPNLFRKMAEPCIDFVFERHVSPGIRL